MINEPLTQIIFFHKIFCASFAVFSLSMFFITIRALKFISGAEFIIIKYGDGEFQVEIR